MEFSTPSRAHAGLLSTRIEKDGGMGGRVGTWEGHRRSYEDGTQLL